MFNKITQIRQNHTYRRLYYISKLFKVYSAHVDYFFGTVQRYIQVLCWVSQLFTDSTFPQQLLHIKHRWQRKELPLSELHCIQRGLLSTMTGFRSSDRSMLRYENSTQGPGLTTKCTRACMRKAPLSRVKSKLSQRQDEW